MREAIERVIAELEAEHKRNWEIERMNINREHQHYRQGGQDGLTFAIEKLKEVITTAADNTRITPRDERDTQSQQ